MRPQPYNPSDISFTAKVWECLRRNSQFRSAFADAESDAKKYLASGNEDDEWVFRSYGAARFHGYAMNHYAFEVLSTCESGWDLRKTWLEQPLKLRLRFASRYGKESALELKPPSFEEFTSETGFDAQKAVRLLTRAYRHGEDYLIIAVPKFIRDNTHRESITAAINRIIPRPMRDARWLKPGGRTLGAKADWRSYLLHEEWTQLGFSFKEAADLSAWEIYGKEKLLRATAEASRNIANSVLRERKSHKYFTKVVDQVRTIEKAIKDVYPEFGPFKT